MQSEAQELERGTNRIEVSSGSVSDGALSSASTDPRGFVTRLSTPEAVELAELNRPIILARV